MLDRAPSLLFPATVRRHVHQQHAGLRALLRRALDQTTRALRGEGGGLEELVAATRELHRLFLAHLNYEERALAPILLILDLWGLDRVTELQEEHARQRAQLNTILEGLESGWDLPRLALTLRSLATDLLSDMEEEEKGCLEAPALREELLGHDRLLY